MHHMLHKKLKLKINTPAHLMLEFCLIIITLYSLYITHVVVVVVIISTPQMAVIDIIYVW